MKPRKLVLWFAILVLSMLTITVQSAQTENRRFPLPDHGFLKLSMPVGWKHQLRQPPERLPPTIMLQAGSGPAFAILITPIWPARADIKPQTPAEMRQQVETAVERIKPQAVEKHIKVNELRGVSGVGYYYAATDKAPKPGEFKYLTQGMLRVDNLLVTFTILTNDGQQGVVTDALTMLRGAVHQRK